MHTDTESSSLSGALLVLAAGVCLAAAREPEPDVSLDDLARFPTRAVAVREANRVREHAERLRFLRCCRAYHPADARDLATLAAWLDYYDWLVIATTEAHATEFRLLALARLREMLGEYHYGRGWRPPAMPDEMLPEPDVWRPTAAKAEGNQ